jgi:hypothetical protein
VGRIAPSDGLESRRRLDHAGTVKRVLVTTLLALLAVPGCVHRIRASTAVEPGSLATLGRRSERIRLVLSEEYVRFASWDRGHLLSDPQRYDLGPALEALTKRYFQATFAHVSLVAGRASVDSVDFVVLPTVVRFENDLTLPYEQRQRLEISLGAVVQRPDGSIVGEVSGSGSHEHAIHPLLEDERRVAGYLGLAIQDALAELLAALGELLDRG